MANINMVAPDGWFGDPKKSSKTIKAASQWVDNHWPDEQNRYVSFDENISSWRYTLGPIHNTVNYSKEEIINYMTAKHQRVITGRHNTDASVDVYDVLKAFNVTCPALQHLIKKALCVGIRGHKDVSTDLNDILESAKRAVELNNNEK